MSKLIIAIIIIVIIVALGYGIYQFLKPTSSFPKSTSTAANEMVLSSLVKGCAETDKGMATNSLSEGTEQEPKIKVSGNQIKYSRAINHACCRKAEIQKEIVSSTINIFEDWSGVECNCICFSEIEATVSNIPSGSYLVNVYEKGTKPFNNEPIEQKLIITKGVHIK